MSPRVILFGAAANVIMTFNAGINRAGHKMAGGKSIDILEQIDEEKKQQLAEIKFNENKKNINPAKCMMCHSDTPKEVKDSETKYYKNFTKPIFAQYPFWLGMYGCINDIVGIDKRG